MTAVEVMIEAMRADPENPFPMLVCADAMEEAGDDAGAEARRFLGEWGLTGEPSEVRYSTGYDSWQQGSWASMIAAEPVTLSRRQWVAPDWWDAASRVGGSDGWNADDVVGDRLMLLKAYAQATPGERADWLRVTDEGLAIYDCAALEPEEATA